MNSEANSLSSASANTTEPTPAQKRLLAALRTISLDDGRVDLALQTGMSGAALERCIDSCKRRGWIDEHGSVLPLAERCAQLAAAYYESYDPRWSEKAYMALRDAATALAEKRP